MTKKGVVAGHEELSPDLAISVAFANNLSNLYHWLHKRSSEVVRFSMTNKDGTEFFAVLSVFPDGEEPKVVFGNGPTYWQALWSVNRAIAADRWRPDKYKDNRGG